MADTSDDLTTVAVRAWALAGRAWMEAANAIVVGWLDLPAVEKGDPGFNEEVVLVPAQPAPTILHPGPFASRWDGTELPRGAVSVLPRRVAAAKDTEVRVCVRQPANLASGTYTGSLLDAPGGACLVDEIGVYVVGGRAH
jgi:hypothetical protein